MMQTQQHDRLSSSGAFLFCLSLFLLCVGLLVIGLGSTSYAQPAFQTMDPPPGITVNEVNDVAKELWCPLCSGVRLDVCELKACNQMKDVIGIKLSEGASIEEIEAYFIEQYGPQVTGEPPREGFNWLAWLMPFAMMILGGGFLWFRARNMVKIGIGLEAPSGQMASGPDVKKPAADDYESKLEEELNRYA